MGRSCAPLCLALWLTSCAAAPVGYTTDPGTGSILDRRRRIFLDNQTGPHVRPGLRYPREDSRMNDGDKVKLFASSHKTWLSLKEAAITHTRGSVTLEGGRYNHYCAKEGAKVVCSHTGGVRLHLEIRDAGWGGKVGLIADGKICSDQHHGLSCTKAAPSGNIGGWEAMSMVDAGDGWVAFKGGRDNKYCADDPDGIRCNRDHLNRWEMFRLHPDQPTGSLLLQSTNEHEAAVFTVHRPNLMSDEVSLRCSNDLYLQVDPSTKKLSCSSKTPAPLNYHRLDGAKWWSANRGSFQDPKTGKYLKAEAPKWGGHVKAEGADKGGWQLFNIQLEGGFEDIFPIIRGVNLGSWFLLEKWMVQRLFTDDHGNDFSNVCAAQDEYGLMKHLSSGTKQKRMEDHWSTWITEADIKWISEHGLNTVRVPFGYWMTHPEAPFIDGQLKYMDKLFTWCEKYKVAVLLDFHGLKGSQNGAQTSGNCGGCEKSAQCGAKWIKFLDNQATNLAVIEKMVSRFASSPVYLGFGVANEVGSSAGGHKTMAFYQKAYDIIRKHSKDSLVIFDATFNPSTYPLQHEGHVTQDDHMYYTAKFGKATGNNMDNMEKAVSRQLNIKRWQLLVGEWALDHHGHYLGSYSGAEKEKWTTGFGKAQLQAFEQHSMGWIYWNYKVDFKVSTWNFKHLCESGWLPGCVSGYKYSPDNWFEHHPCAYTYLHPSHMGADCSSKQFVI